MSIRRLTLLIVVAIALAACGGAPVSPGSSTPAPVASNAAPTVAAAPTAAPSSMFVGLSSGLDNAKQARIRIANGVTSTSRVDVFINGLPAFNAGKPQQNIAVGEFSGWLYVAPGTYAVALVPHGGK